MAQFPPIPKAPDREVFGAGYDLSVMMARRAIRKSKPPVGIKQIQVFVGRRCWVDLNITKSSASVSAIGVVDPDGTLSARAAAASHNSSDNEALGCMGIGVIAIFVIGAVMAHGSTGTGVGFLCALLVAVALVVTVLRHRDARRDSRVIRAGNPSFQLMFNGMVRLGQISVAVERFNTEMRRAAKKAHLEPLSLPESTQAASRGISLALWQVASLEATVDKDAIADGIEAVAKAVFDSVETAWEMFEGFAVPIPDAPVDLVKAEPQPPAVDAGRLLGEVAGQIEIDRAMVHETTKEIARINRPENDAFG